MFKLGPASLSTGEGVAWLLLLPKFFGADDAAWLLKILLLDKIDGAALAGVVLGYGASVIQPITFEKDDQSPKLKLWNRFLSTKPHPLVAPWPQAAHPAQIRRVSHGY